MGGRDHSYECGTCGMERGGLNDVPCDCDTTSDSGLIWLNFEIAMHRLARNIRDAAGLCRADFIARKSATRIWTHDDHDEWTRWKPGCGRSAPHPHRDDLAKGKL